VSIDNELGAALGRTDPPAGFAARTVERLASAGTGRPPAASPRRAAMLAVAASLVLTVTGSGYLVRWRAERQAERARRDVAIALEIVERTLNDVRARVITAVQRTGASHAQPSPPTSPDASRGTPGP
jgi:hypothetical protein